MLPAPSRGNRSVKPIYQAVGHALSQWELVEFFLSSLFRTFVESHSDAASRAYGAIVSTTGRYDALSEASQVFFMRHQNKFDSENAESLKKLLGSYRNATGRRNDIAHGWAIYIKIENKSKGAYLQAPDYNSRKRDPIKFSTSLGSNYSYSKSEIDELADKFTMFAEQIMQHNLFIIEKLRL